MGRAAVGLALLELIALLLPAAAIVLQLAHRRAEGGGRRWRVVTAVATASFLLLTAAGFRIVQKLAADVPYWRGEVGILALGVYALGACMIPLLTKYAWDAVAGAVR